VGVRDAKLPGFRLLLATASSNVLGWKVVVHRRIWWSCRVAAGATLCSVAQSRTVELDSAGRYLPYFCSPRPLSTVALVCQSIVPRSFRNVPTKSPTMASHIPSAAW